ncbi:hypothetical protein RHSIM_Rhsim11G0066000 [Rhododendron simsii]|uniref:BPL/LPL catalytic domain-containing protein n=1 Tax=Rhododendron simsii TaxID=118357 RepID=A0A834LB50_RHOSS|nr:hypothetical protein RHSIM_Rhsim11G0066000 [Rhododendron simsii]
MGPLAQRTTRPLVFSVTLHSPTPTTHPSKPLTSAPRMPFNSKYYFTPNLLHFLSLKNSLSPLPPLRLLLSKHNKTHPLTSPLSLSQSIPAMDSQTPCRLVLCGKSSAEKELAKSIKDSKALKLPDNAELEIVLHSDTETPIEENYFRCDSFLSSLSTTRFGRFLIWSPRLPSTHDVVSHNFCELPVGTVCVADVQFKGRGRSQNMWESPRGCLMFSFTIQMEDGRVVPLVQWSASMMVLMMILHGFPVYLTSGFKKPREFCFLHISKPAFVENALRLEEIFSTEFPLGFQPLEQLYYQAWLHRGCFPGSSGGLSASLAVEAAWNGQRVIVQEKDDNQLVENVVTVQGLTSSGYLLAVGEDGQMCELHPDGNRGKDVGENDKGLPLGLFCDGGEYSAPSIGCASQNKPIDYGYYTDCPTIAGIFGHISYLMLRTYHDPSIK